MKARDYIIIAGVAIFLAAFVAVAWVASTEIATLYPALRAKILEGR